MSRTIVIDLFNGQGYSDSTAFEVNAWNDGIEQAQEIVNAQFTDDDERIVEVGFTDGSVWTEWTTDEVDWGFTAVTEAKADVYGVLLMPDTLDYDLLTEEDFKNAVDLANVNLEYEQERISPEGGDAHTDLGFMKLIKL